MPRKRKDGKWLIDFTAHGRRVRRVLPAVPKREAERIEAQMHLDALNGLLTSTSYGDGREVPTLTDFAPIWLRDYAVPHNKLATVAAKESGLRVHLLPALGKLRLDEIDSAAIAKFAAGRLDEGLAPKTVNNLLVVLRKLLATAEDWGIIEHVPKVQLLRLQPAGFDFLDFDEADRLLAAAKREGEFYPLIVVLLRAGLRSGEARALRWEDTDLRAGLIHVRRSEWRGTYSSPKSNQHRTVPMSGLVRDVLQAHRHLKGELVFCNEDGSGIQTWQLREALKRCCRRAGLRHVSPHTLRHTFASHLAMRGVPLKAIQELLGHAGLAMTLRYSHMSPSVHTDAVALLDGPAEQEPRQDPVTRGQGGKRARFEVLENTNE